MDLHRRGWRVAAAAGLVVVGLVCVATAWATPLTPQRLVTAKGKQVLPSAAPAGAYLAYSQSRPGRPNQYDVYVKPAGRRRYKVNARGQGFAGGIDGTTLIWQRARTRHSDLRLFDLASQTGSVPAGVNTRRWEFWPTISGTGSCTAKTGVPARGTGGSFSTIRTPVKRGFWTSASTDRTPRSFRGR